MADKKKRRGRRAYLNDYKLGEDGQYRYTGVQYRLRGKLPKRQVLLSLWIPAAVLIAATLGSACIPAAAMFGAFGALPFIGEVAAGGSAIWALAKLTPSVERPYEHVYKATVERLPRRAVVTAIFAGVGLCGCVLHTLLYGFAGTLWWTLLLWLTKAGQAASALWLRRNLKKLEWRPRKSAAAKTAESVSEDTGEAEEQR